MNMVITTPFNVIISGTAKKELFCIYYNTGGTMKKCLRIFTLVIFVLVYLGTGTFTGAESAEKGIQSGGEGLFSSAVKLQGERSKPGKTPKVDVNYGKIPIYFIPNEGQVDKRSAFYAKASRYTLWITKEGLIFDSISNQGTGENLKPSGFNHQLQPKEAENIITDLNSKASFRDVSRLLFVGANRNPEIVAVEETLHRVNYFIGKDPSKWKKDIVTSKAVLYKDIYPNIDLKIYGIEKEIEYDWIIKPDGDPSDIKFEYKNVKKVSVNKKGDLDIRTRFGTLVHKKPFAYQNINVGGVSFSPQVKSEFAEIKATFKKTDKNTYGFAIGKYDKKRPLVIDPMVLVYSTYLGGSSEERGFGITVDSSGSAFIAGATSSTNFPTLNYYQGNNAGGYDVFVTKLSPSGNALVYSTYIGGSGGDYAEAIEVDASGIANIVGFTNSSDYPTLNPYQSSHAGSYDVLVTKLSSSGNALVYSTYLGGNADDFGYDLNLDATGIVYITGFTYSTNFPTLNPYQANNAGVNDGFVTKLSSSGSTLIYSTYIGGSGNEYEYEIEVDSGGNAYITGYTNSADYPTLNPYQSSNSGSWDTYITKFSPSGSTLIYSTYLGGNGSDRVQGINIDASGNAYVSGYTDSTNFPTLNPYQANNAGSADVFVTKLSPLGSTLVYSTYIGGTNSDYGYDIKIDSGGNAYITGYTNSANYPTLYPYQAGNVGGGDAFVTKLSSSGNVLVYSTYLGGNNTEYVHSIDVDHIGDVYITGHTLSSNFPTFNPYQGNHSGGYDGLVTKFSFNADLSVLKTVDNSYPNEGSDVTFSINLTNNGPADASSVDVTDILPTGLLFQSANVTVGSYNNVSGLWSVGNISNGTTETLEIVATVTTGGSFTNTATVNTFTEDDPAGGNDSDSVTISTNYTVIASVSGGNGSVSPSTQNVSYNGSASINISPNAGYIIATITDNGVSQALADPYEINNVIADHIVEVTFSLESYTVNASVSGGNGSVSPSTQNVSYNEAASINISPNAGYEIATITDNGVIQPVSNPYIIPNVRDDHSIVVTFQKSVIINLNITAERKNERAWILSRNYGELTFTVDNKLHTAISNFVVERSTDGGNFVFLTQFGSSDLTNDSFKYLDKYLEKDKNYSYKFSAYDQNGKKLAVSNITGI